MMKTKTVSILARGVFTQRSVMSRVLRAALLTSTALTINASAVPAWAQESNWLANPVDGNFSNGANWNTGIAPTGGVVNFADSQIKDLFLNTNNLALAGWFIREGAGDYTVNNRGFVRFNGPGIGVEGGSITIENTTDFSSLLFEGTSSAGSAAIINTANSGITFLDRSTADAATLTIDNGQLLFGVNATGGNAVILNNANVLFLDYSTAGNASIINGQNGYVAFQTLGADGDGKITAGSIAGGGVFELGDSELTVGSNNLNTEVTGTVQNNVGNGSLVKMGTGTLILSGENLYTGGTKVDGGTLQLGSGGTTGSVAGNIVNNGVLVFNRSNDFTVSGDISGTGAVQQIGAGTTILTSTNSYTGDTTITGGRLQFGDGTTGGVNTLGGNINVSRGSLAVHTPATLNVAQTLTLGNNTTLAIVAGADSPTIAADKVIIGNGVTFNISGIRDASRLEKVLINTTSGISGDFAAVTVGGFSSPLDYLTLSTHKSDDGKQYLARYGLNWTSNNNLSHGTFTLDDDTPFTVGANLADQAANAATGWDGKSLIKAGGGELILTGTNSYSGGTRIDGGRLQLGNGGTSGSIVGDVTNDGILGFYRSDDITFSGSISGSGTVMKAGASTLTLSGTNTYTGGTYIGQGTLQISSDENLGIGGELTLIQGATLSYTRSNTYTHQIGLAGGDVNLNVEADLEVTQSGEIGDASLAGRLVKTGGGILTLTSANTYTGGTTVAGGTLRIASDANIGIGGTLSLRDTTTLAYAQSNEYTHAITVSGSANLNVATDVEAWQSGNITDGEIAGEIVKGHIIKTGGGRLMLTGDNNYTGGTTINAGTLQLGTDDLFASLNGAVTTEIRAVFDVVNGDTSGAVINNNGRVDFHNDSSAGSAEINLGSDGAAVYFYARSTAGSATINFDSNSGTVQFEEFSKAGTATITNRSFLNFRDDTTAENATIINQGNMSIEGKSTAGSADITNDKSLAFWGNGTAGNAAITNTENGTVDFSGSTGKNGDNQISVGSIAGAGKFILGANKLTVGAEDSSTDVHDVTGVISGTGKLIKDGTATLVLSGTNTYTGNTTINRGTLQLGTATTAGTILGDVALGQRGNLEIVNADLSGMSRIDSDGTTNFRNGTSANGVIITNNGTLNFYNNSTAGRTEIDNFSNRNMSFNDTSNAGTAWIMNSGNLSFNGKSTAGLAEIINTVTGTVDFSATRGLNDDRKISAGSIDGMGNYDLGANELTVGGNNLSTNVSGVISGNGGSLVKVGTGTLTLSGANTYTGGTTISGGELQIGEGYDTGSITGNVINNALLTFNCTGELALSGNISGTGRVQQIGSGTTILTGSLTYTGGTTISAGTLQIGGGDSTSSLAGNIANGSRLIFNSTGTVTLSGAVSGNGTVEQLGTGTTILTGSNTYTGNTTIENGRLQFGNDRTGGNSTVGEIGVNGGATLAVQKAATLEITGALNLGDGSALSIMAGSNSPTLFANTITIGNGVTFDITGISSEHELDKELINTTNGITGDFATITVGGFNRTVDYLTVSARKSEDGKKFLASYGLNWTSNNNLSHGTFTLENAGDRFTVDTALENQAGNGDTDWDGTALTKAGAGTLILTGANTYTGGTTISGGTLQLGDGGMTGSLIGDVLNNGVLVFNRDGVLTLDRDISGTGSVRQIGSGTTVLSGTNTYTGGTVISGGTLQLGDGNAAGSITGNVENNSVLAFNHNVVFTFSSGISGTGSVVKQGTNTLTLDGTSSYSGGTRVEGGRLQISSDSNLGNGGTLALLDGTTLAFTENDTYTHAITAAGRVTLEADRGFDGRNLTVTQSGVISDGESVGQLVKTGRGTLILTGDNTHTGGTTISGGILQIGDGGATGSLTGDIVNDNILAFNRSGTLTISGDISGSGRVRQIGSGTTILTGNNSYTAITAINAGTLQFGDGSNSNNTLGGWLTVSEGATLAVHSSANVDVAQYVNLYSNSALTIIADTNEPALTADTVNIDPDVVLNISGISDESQLEQVLIDTRYGITGEFATVTINGFSSPVDYATVTTYKSADLLQYLARTSLSWMSNNSLSHGTFTVDGTTPFTLGTVLSDQTVTNSATLWDGKSLTKKGNGTFILTGDNTYTGVTTINGGTLQLGAGGTTGSVSGDIVNNGILAINRSDALTVSNSISGTGSVLKQGANTLTLDGANNYSGSTMVEDGTLIGTAASISGNISNAGIVVFDQASDASFAGNIAGFNNTSGDMIKRGAGTLTLTGTSALDWTVEAGALVASGGKLSGNIEFGLGTSLTFNDSVNGTYGGVLTGSGELIKTGAGHLILTGDSSDFTGSTKVSGGILAVNGSLGGSIGVEGDGRLQGSGTMGAITASGIIAPGNSIGTLNVSSINFTSSSIYEVEVNAAGASDKIIASGAATIDSGSTVRVLAETGSYAPQTQYTILTANGGLTGTFGSVSANFAFLDSAISYDANNAYLTLTRNNIDFAGIGFTRNQIATGAGAESLGWGNAIFNAVVNLSEDQARHAFNQLSGEVHASAKTALIEDSRFIRNAANDRIRAAFNPDWTAADSDGLAFWSEGFGSRIETNSDGNAARLSRSTSGFLIGADAPVFDNWRFGAMGGYSRTSFDVKDRQSSGSSDNYHFGVYGGTAWGDLAFRTGASYTWHDISTSRNVTFSTFNNSLTGDYDGSTTQIFGEFAYGFHAIGARFEPFANLAYVNLHTDGFTEQGGASALDNAALNNDATFTTLGLRASTTFDLGGGTLVAKGMLGWRHAMGDETPDSTVRFASGGDSFSIGGIPLARDAVVIEAGIDHAIAPNAALGVSYNGQFGSGVSDQSGRVNLNLKF